MHVILFRGRPGTGKTTLALALAAQTGYPVLSKDTLHDTLAPFIGEHALRGQAAYDCLYATLHHNQRSSCTFIVDYPFQALADFRYFQAWCQARQTTLCSVLVDCSDEAAWAARFEERAKNPLPNQLITSFSILKNHYSTLHLTPEPEELAIDSATPVAALLPQVRAFLAHA